MGVNNKFDIEKEMQELRKTIDRLNKELRRAIQIKRTSWKKKN